MNFAIIRSNVYQTNSICCDVYMYRNVILILLWKVIFIRNITFAFHELNLPCKCFVVFNLLYFQSYTQCSFSFFFFFNLNTMLCLDISWCEHSSISAQDKDISCSAKNSKARVVTRFDKLREMRNHCPNTIFFMW